MAQSHMQGSITAPVAQAQFMNKTCFIEWFEDNRNIGT